MTRVGSGLEPAGEQSDDVERCLVGPVDILQDEDVRRLLPKVVHQRRDDVMRRCLAGDRFHQRAPQTVGNSEEGSERPRREQRIAPAREHLYGLRLLVTEPTDECRLADACLSDDDDEPPAPDRSLRNRTREHIECALALEQIELLNRPG